MIFTIAIPVHNGACSIMQTLDSCINQDFDLEYDILVVDNASTDDTVERIKTLSDPKIRLIEESELVNVSANHNRCLLNAKGDYVIFCHADDVLLPSALSDFFHILERRRFPSRYVLWGHSMFRDFQSALLNTPWKINELIVGERAYTIFLVRGITPSATCYSRESFVNEGGFIEFEHWYDPTDLFSMIKLAFRGFSFEMVENMFFNRRVASRAKKETPLRVYLEAFEEGVLWLKDNLEHEDMLKFLSPDFVRIPPLYFLYCLSSHKAFRRPVAKSCMKYLIKNPTNLRHRHLISALLRSLFLKSRY